MSGPVKAKGAAKSKPAAAKKTQASMGMMARPASVKKAASAAPGVQDKAAKGGSAPRAFKGPVPDWAPVAPTRMPGGVVKRPVQDREPATAKAAPRATSKSVKVASPRAKPELIPVFAWPKRTSSKDVERLALEFANRSEGCID